MNGFGARKTKAESIKLIEIYVSGKYVMFDFLFLVVQLL